MHKVLSFSLLLTALAGAAPAGWTPHTNEEPDPARPLGWSFETPNEWRQAPMPSFPYPLGESWTGKDGLVQVCWLGSHGALSEQSNLEERGYARSERRLAGREAVCLESKDDTFCYVKTPQGQCRVHVKSSHSISAHVLQSFTMRQTAAASAADDVVYEKWSFQLPNGWTFQAPDLLQAGGRPIARLSHHPLPKEVSLRGFARNDGKESEGLKDRLDMEPFSSRNGVDGYLVEWKTAGGSQVFGYAGAGGEALRLQLLEAGGLTSLRRLLTTLKGSAGTP